jgi:uncharacterized membrane protein YeiH
MQAQLNLLGIFVFGISGALMAIHRDFDIVGIATLAVTTALGGGIVRDLVLGDTPPVAFTHWEYLVLPLAGAAVSFVAHPELERLTRTLLIFDAAGLGSAAAVFGVRALHRHWRGPRAGGAHFHAPPETPHRSSTAATCA